MAIFNSGAALSSSANNKFKDKFGSDGITLGKTSTKRATNISLLKESTNLNKILDKGGQQFVRGRGSRVPASSNENYPKPLQELRSV